MNSFAPGLISALLPGSNVTMAALGGTSDGRLSALVGHRQHAPIGLRDLGVDGPVGHRAFRREIPGAMTFAHALHTRRALTRRACLPSHNYPEPAGGEQKPKQAIVARHGCPTHSSPRAEAQQLAQRE
jgi:hypothetical protein